VVAAQAVQAEGNGRARQGSRRAPNHVGGGTVHGPKPRSYAYSAAKKVRRGALRSALSLRAQEGRLVVVQDLNLGEVKTKKAAEIFEKLVGQYALIVEGENRELSSPCGTCRASSTSRSKV
jgi:large subunit ribosomal protein L4